MDLGVCLLSVIPVRAADSDTSEIVTQLLFGEYVYLIGVSEKPNWIKIRCCYDNYEGWIDPKQIDLLGKKNYKEPLWLDEGLVHHNGQSKRLSFGSGQINSFEENELIYSASSELFTFSDVVSVAEKYLGVPYLWGGRSQYGIDCSGFTQQVYKMCGVKLPRDASQQALVSDKITTLQSYNVGDLAFFHNSKGNIIHVGIMIEGDNIIHAHGQVKVDSIDEKGILDGEGTYSHQLTYIKQFV